MNHLVGDIAQIGKNYSISAIPKNITPFYKNCLTAWAKFSSNEPFNFEVILLQNIWNNKMCKTKFNQKLSALGINKVSDILDAQGKFKKINRIFTSVIKIISDLSKLASKDVYRTIIKTEREIPTAKSKLEKKSEQLLIHIAGSFNLELFITIYMSALPL